MHWPQPATSGDIPFFTRSVLTICCFFTLLTSNLGGFYFDDDGYIEASLDSVARDDDHFVVGKEGLESEECFQPSYHLSVQYLQKLYNIHGKIDKDFLQFDGKVIGQWTMYSRAGSPVLLELLQNVVDIIKHEYTKESILIPTLHQHTVVVCSTGPLALTATLRSILLRQKYKHSTNYTIKVASVNFAEYGGIYKILNFVPYSGNRRVIHDNFYWHMRKFRIPLLKTYVNDSSPPPDLVGINPPGPRKVHKHAGT